MGSEMIAFFLAFLRISGLLALVIAGVRLFNWRELLGGMKPMITTKTSTADELKDVIQAIQSNLGDADMFREKVELKGVIRSSQPIIAELSEKPCVYVRTRYEERFEETYKDEEENSYKVRQVSKVLADNTRTQLFQLEDHTGSITVNPEGAKFELTEVVNRFEPFESHEKVNGRRSFGERRNFGRQYNEWIVPLGVKVYVLGEISRSANGFVVQKPLQEGYPFLITRRSEESLIQEKRLKARKALNDGVVSLMIAILLIFIAPKVLLLLVQCCWQ